MSASTAPYFNKSSNLSNALAQAGKLFILCLMLIIAVGQQATFAQSSDSLGVQDTTQTDSIPSDSLSSDTISLQEKKKAPLDEPVDYEAEDSMRFDLNEQKVYLFGNAKVTHKKIELEADHIEFSFNNNTVFAKGTEDSTGEITGKPLFKEGEKSFDADRMRYNFKTKKGLIHQVHTQEGDGDLYSQKTKKHPNGEIHVKGGKYTTCEPEDYHIRFGKAVVIPNDKIVSGPANLVIADIPTPVVLPFGYYPNQDGEAAGIILPSYGESPTLGFYLLNAGYYWPVNDQMDTRFLFDIYSKGSWGAKNFTRYNKRYKYNGNLNLTYSKMVRGEPEFPDYEQSQEFFVRWNHKQDPKARPNSNFSAKVNFGTTDNFQNNFNSNTEDYLTNSFQSNVSWSRRWRNRPYNLNVSARHNQSSKSQNYDITLPSISFNINRFYPLEALKKEQVGGRKWYEKIGMTYSTEAKNRLTAKARQFNQDSIDLLTNNLKNGLKHNLKLQTSFKKWHMALNPQLSMGDRWYLESYEKRWDDDLQRVVRDTISGFKSVRDYNAKLGLTTKLYGMYQFKSKKLKAVRHVFTPNVGFSYRPDAGTTKEADLNNDGNMETYSPYEGMVFGAPNSREVGRININITNSLEMKLRNLEDTTKKDKKVRLLENFRLGTNYDIFKDSLQWSNISFSGNTNLFDNNINVRFSGNLDPYSRDAEGNRLNESLLKDKGKLARLNNATLSIGGRFSGEKSTSIEDKEIGEEQLERVRNNPQAFVNFNVPWSFSPQYTLNFNQRFIDGQDSLEIIQTLDLRGDVKITDNWKIGFKTGYDFVAKEMSYTTINIYRDLGCWEMSFEWIPFGDRRSYNFQINIKSPLLKDFKLKRKREWYDQDLEFE